MPSGMTRDTAQAQKMFRTAKNPPVPPTPVPDRSDPENIESDWPGGREKRDRASGNARAGDDESVELY